MDISSPANLGRSVLVIAVIVLYQRGPAESAAFVTLSALLAREESMSRRMACILYDNGPSSSAVPESPFPILYFHDPRNAGLAVAYEFARTQADRLGAPWLLLLDQDTHLTAAYLNEAVQQATRLQNSPEIAAIAPKLVQGDLLLSPHWPPRHHPASSLRERSGPIEPPLQVFNSGSWLRVSAVTALGGFPLSFPMDYLDHAVYSRLQRSGGRVYLLRAELQHDLAALHMDLLKDFGRVPRLESILRAESRFYRLYGTPRDKAIYSLRRTRLIIRMLLARNVRGAMHLFACTFRPEG